MALLRWAQWTCCEKGPDDLPQLRLPLALRWERTADAVVDSLTTALRSLVIGVFALTRSTITKLSRCATTVI